MTTIAKGFALGIPDSFRAIEGLFTMALLVTKTLFGPGQKERFL
jgi:hypothetical protein